MVYYQNKIKFSILTGIYFHFICMMTLSERQRDKIFMAFNIHIDFGLINYLWDFHLFSS